MVCTLLIQLFKYCFHGCRLQVSLYLISILSIAIISAFDAYTIYLVGSENALIPAKASLLLVITLLLALLPVRYIVNRTLLQSSSSISFFIANSNFLSFLRQQYSTQYSISTGKLIVLASDIPNQIGSLILQPFAQFVSSTLTILFLLVALYSLVGVVSLAPIVLLTAVYYSYVSNSQPNLKSNSEIIKNSLVNINDLIKNLKLNLPVLNLYDLNDYYQQLFRAANRNNKLALSSNSVILSSPKVILDGLIILAIFLFYIYSAFESKPVMSSGSVVAILFSISRIVPAAQSVARLYSTITSAIPYLESCHLDCFAEPLPLVICHHPKSYSTSTPITLSLRNLVLPWGLDTEACNKIGLFRLSEFTSGRPNIITGPSGSGKSTLLQILAGLIQPHSGTFTYKFENQTIPDSAFNGLIDYIPQHPNVLIGTTMFNVSFSSRLLSPSDLDRYTLSLQKVNLAGFNSLSDLTKLSGGERYRLSIARSLYSGRPILLLDEPFAALDIHNVQLIYNSLLDFSKNHLVIIVSHSIPSFVETSSLIYHAA
jgi:ABC-type multidrug transport system fused ATPase/permease subunit